MSLIAGIEIPQELLRLFRELVRINDMNRYGSVALNGHLLSRAQSKKVSTRSLLPQIAVFWAGLSAPQKMAWKAAAAETSANGWNLFVQDTAYRIKHTLAGLAIPSDFHQYKAGKMVIASPAFGAKLVQYHPEYYYKQQKVRGTKALFIDVRVEEKLALPLEVGLSYKSEMIAAGNNPEVKFYAKVLSNYQGRTIETEAGFAIDLESSWARETVILSEVIGVVRSYDLYINFTDVRGTFYWDNVLAHHTGTNYARDFRCTDVNNELTRSNYQIEKSWEEETLPNGASYDSVYVE